MLLGRNGFGNDSFCKLLLRGDSLTDASPSARAVTNNGVTLTTDAAFPGGKCLVFGGAASLGLADSTVFDLTGASVATLDLFFKPTSLAAQQQIMSKGTDGTIGWALYVTTSGAVRLQYDTTTILTSALTLSAGTVGHIMLVKSGDYHAMFVNGLPAGSVSTATRPTASPYLNVGVLRNAGQNLNGRTAGLRWSPGIVRQNRGFTPPNREC